MISSIASELDRRNRLFKADAFPFLSFPAVDSLRDSLENIQLQPITAGNEQFISHLGWLTVSRQAVQAIEDDGLSELRERCHHLLTRIDTDIATMRTEKENQWRIHRLLTVFEPQHVDGQAPQTIDTGMSLKPY